MWEVCSSLSPQVRSSGKLECRKSAELRERNSVTLPLIPRLSSANPLLTVEKVTGRPIIYHSSDIVGNSSFRSPHTGLAESLSDTPDRGAGIFHGRPSRDERPSPFQETCLRFWIEVDRSTMSTLFCRWQTDRAIRYCLIGESFSEETSELRGGFRRSKRCRYRIKSVDRLEPF